MRAWISNGPACLVAGIVIGLVVGLNMAGLWPNIPLHATATHGLDKFAIATGLVDDSVEALYFLDFLTGDMRAAVINPKTGKFNSFYTRNIATDFGGAGKERLRRDHNSPGNRQNNVRVRASDGIGTATATATEIENDGRGRLNVRFLRHRPCRPNRSRYYGRCRRRPRRPPPHRPRRRQRRQSRFDLPSRRWPLQLSCRRRRPCC